MPSSLAISYFILSRALAALGFTGLLLLATLITSFAFTLLLSTGDNRIILDSAMLITNRIKEDLLQWKERAGNKTNIIEQGVRD
jgi:hypothetical protein